ncbi:MAG: hypothetical protein HC828_11470 [Blastochloris sp.]|nr:hypothetical protein [Blastochloris sp.]
MPLNFVGNIEPKDLAKHNVDVVVTDGFTGNLIIKTMEASTSAMSGLIREEVMRDTVSKLGGLLARGAFRRVYRRVDPFEIGGAPLLGVNGVVIIGHGRSNARAIKNAIRQARAAVESDLDQADPRRQSRTAPWQTHSIVFRGRRLAVLPRRNSTPKE